VSHGQGKYEEALEWYMRALILGENTLGKDDPDVPIAVNNTGSLFHDQRRYDKALEWRWQALARREKGLTQARPTNAHGRPQYGADVSISRKKHDTALE
jgi:tetratricopeptide (TPR) repeat protein